MKRRPRKDPPMAMVADISRAARKPSRAERLLILAGEAGVISGRAAALKEAVNVARRHMRETQRAFSDATIEQTRRDGDAQVYAIRQVYNELRRLK